MQTNAHVFFERINFEWCYSIALHFQVKDNKTDISGRAYILKSSIQ